MKKLYLLLIILFTCSISVKSLHADCEEDKISVSGVSVYKMNISNENETTVRFEIYGLKENLYAIITNNYNSENIKIGYSDLKEDKVAYFYTADVSKKINYTIDVYSNSCGDEKLKTISLKTDKYNPYSTNNVCLGYWSIIDYCNPFYDNDDLTEEEFVIKVKEKIEEIRPRTIIEYIKSYYIYVLMPVLILTFIFAIRVIILKKRRAKK